jgi:hypothetical protein
MGRLKMSIWTKYDYTFAGFGGADNCQKCDDFGHVDEFDRSDGACVALCKSCAEQIVRSEPKKLICAYGHTYDKPTSLGCPECLAEHLEKGGTLD